MPELPDVEGFRRTAEKAAHRVVRGVDVRDAQVVLNSGAADFGEALRGRRFAEPHRYGKVLQIPTENPPAGSSPAGSSPAGSSPDGSSGAGSSGAGSSADGMPSLLVHFGMTGALLWCEPDEPPHAHDRVVFRFDGGELRYRDMRKLKGVRIAREPAEAAEVLDGLGPDAAAVSRAEFAARLTRTRRQVKTALTDQAVLAGLGNLTADEVLWRARVAPHRQTTELTRDELDALHRRMRSTLREASRAGLVPNRPSWLSGHRADQRCPRCSERLSQRRMSGRTTIWCPVCQPD